METANTEGLAYDMKREKRGGKGREDDMKHCI